MSLYLVTGGCGFIGSHLADTLVDAGHSVRVLDDLSTGNRANLPPSADLMIGDVRDGGTVERALRDVDGCFHLAAVVSVTGCEKQWESAHQINLTGSLNLFRQASKARNGKPIPVVYASSAAVYGEARAVPTRERAPAHPINAYGADKAACELHARAIARGTRASITGLRLFNVYGPRQRPDSTYAGVISIFCDRLVKGQPVEIYGDGRQTRDFIHVSDVVQYLIRAMQSSCAGGDVYNVCTGKALSVVDLAETIAKLCGNGLEIRFRPWRDGDIRHSAGDPSRAAARFGYRSAVTALTGLAGLIERNRASRHAGPSIPTIAAQ